MSRTANILQEGHVAVVIGAGGAIGAACARAFAEAGATVWSVDLLEQAAAGALTDLAGGHRTAACDVTDPASCERLAELVGKADSVVYAAGLNADGNVVDIDWNAYRKVMAVNLDGAFHIGAAFGRRMSARGAGGAFVFLSSTAGLRGEAGASIYCASKFGLIGFVESMAAEFAGERIRVNTVCPGTVDSPMLRDVARRIAERTGADAEDIWREMAHSGAARRLVTPAEVATLCLHLASPASAAITGTTVRVDAGAMLSA